MIGRTTVIAAASILGMVVRGEPSDTGRAFARIVSVAAR